MIADGRADGQGQEFSVEGSSLWSVQLDNNSMFDNSFNDTPGEFAVLR